MVLLASPVLAGDVLAGRGDDDDAVLLLLEQDARKASIGPAPAPSADQRMRSRRLMLSAMTASLARPGK